LSNYSKSYIIRAVEIEKEIPPLRLTSVGMTACMSKSKKYSIYIIIIAAIAGGFYLYKNNASQSNKAEYVTMKAVAGNLVQSVEATGKVESAQRIELNFKTAGRISDMNAAVGDEVRQGQLLARLESGALLSRVADARAQVDSAQAAYDQLLAGASAEDIQVKEDTVAQKEKSLEAVKNTLTNLRGQELTELKNLKDTAITAINNQISVAEASLEEIDNTLDDPDAADTISIQNIGAMQTAKSDKKNADDLVLSVKNTLNGVNVYSADSEVLGAIDEIKAMLSQVSTALANTITVLQATITSTKLSETALDTLKANIQAQQTLINAAQTNVQTAKTNWTNRIAYFNDQTTAAKDAINSAEAAVKVAGSELALKKSPPRQFEIDSQKAKLNQADAALSLALANLEEAAIRAPLAGIISKKYSEAGEQTSLASPVLEMIGKATLEIDVDIPESDISKLAMGQKAEITLDAFGDDRLFDGSVTFVDPSETLIQDVVYYRVKAAFSGEESDIKPGMTANVKIFTNTKENVLQIPFRAVKTRNNSKYVEVLVNGVIQEKTVTLGIRGDDGVEILTGLAAGDEVVSFVKEK